MGTILFLGPLVTLMLFTPSFALGLNAAPESTANVTLAWNPSPAPGLAGYNIYFGAASRIYSGKVSVDSSTTNATVNNLQAGQTYYFAVTATNSAGVESDYSAEVVHMPQNAAALHLRLASNGQVVLSVTGPAERMYGIEASSDFSTWSAIGTVKLGSGGMAEFADTTPAIVTAMFYRVVEQLPPNLQIRVASNQQAILTLSGPVGRIYDIQASSDLIAWAVIGNATVPAGGSFEFTDTNAPHFPQRFYRARDTQL